MSKRQVFVRAVWMCLGLASVVAGLGGCADDADTEAPRAPVVNPVVSPTSLDEQVLSGSAEPGSTVTIQAIGATVTTVADAYTAGWRVAVPLTADGVNTLDVTATDAAGNESLPTRVVIAQEAPRPEHLSVSLTRSVISTDDAALTAVAVVGNDEAGVSLEGMAVRFSLGDFAGVQDQVVAADAHGRAVATFSGLTVPGDALLTATAVADETLSDSAAFTVVPGSPATFTVTLAATGGDGAASDAVTVPAGTDVAVEVTLTDASGNPVDAPVSLSGPGVLRDGVLKGLTTAGAFEVTASLVGTLRTASAALTVTPGPAATIDLSLSTGELTAGESVVATAVARDAYGNAAAQDGLTLAADTAGCAPLAEPDCLEADVTGGSGTFALNRAGLFPIRAALSAGGVDLSAEATVRVVAAAPVSVTVELADDGGTALGDPAQLAVGGDLHVLPTVLDAFGNTVDRSVAVATDAPGAVALGHTISHLWVAGDFQVLVSVDGSALSATRDVAVVPGAPAELSLALEPELVVAGQPVVVTARVLDAFGNDTGAVPSVGVTPSAAALDGLAPTCAGHQDPAVAPFAPCVTSATALDALGSALAVTASFGELVSVSKPLTVLPAPAQAIAQFEPDPAGPGADGQILAGEDLPYRYRVEDGYGNRVDVPIAVTVTDPDAKVLDDGVSGAGLIAGLVRASSVSYQVTARISGTGVTKGFAMRVDPAAGERFVSLLPSTSSIAMGGEVILSATARDLYGNTLPGASFSFAVDTAGCAPLPLAECLSPATAQTGAGATFAIMRVGVFGLTATYSDSYGTFSDTRYVTVQPVIDVTPPTVTLTNVRRNGVLCASPTACTWRVGDTVSFEVNVVDDHGISQVSYSSFFATAGTSGTLRSRIILIPSGTTTASPSFTFTIPNNTAFEDVDLVAQALDQVGNIANSASWPLRIRAIDPVIADGKDHSLEVVGVVTGGADVDDAVVDASGRLLAVDANNDRLVQILSPTSFFTLANLNAAPTSIAADAAGNVYVSTSNGNGNGSALVRLNAAGTLATYLDVGNAINTGSGTAGACEPGNGNNLQVEGLTVLPVLRGSVRISPNPPPSGAHVRIADASGSPSQTYTFGGQADVCGVRDALRTAFNNTPFAGLSALRGPCTTQGIDYGELELLADYSLVPGATDVLNNSGNANVSTDSPVDLQSTLLFGSRSRYVHTMDAVESGAAPSCYRTRFDFGGGEIRSVAAAYQGSPAALTLYGADRSTGAIRRMVASTGTSQTLATVSTPHDLVVAPSGCVIVSEEGTDRVTMIDPASPSCIILPCDTQVLADGFDAIRGLAMDYVDVVAEYAPWMPATVSLEARVPGAAGNALPLSASSAAFALAGFSGGTNGAAGAKAVGSIVVGGGVGDGDVITVGTATYEVDLPGTPGVASGHVPVHVDSAAANGVAQALASTIRQTEARLLVTDRTADAIIEIRPTRYDTTDCF